MTEIGVTTSGKDETGIHVKIKSQSFFLDTASVTKALGISNNFLSIWWDLSLSSSSAIGEALMKAFEQKAEKFTETEINSLLTLVQDKLFRENGDISKANKILTKHFPSKKDSDLDFLQDTKDYAIHFVALLSKAKADIKDINSETSNKTTETLDNALKTLKTNINEIETFERRNQKLKDSVTIFAKFFDTNQLNDLANSIDVIKNMKPEDLQALYDTYWEKTSKNDSTAIGLKDQMLAAIGHSIDIEGDISPYSDSNLSKFKAFLDNLGKTKI